MPQLNNGEGPSQATVVTPPPIQGIATPAVETACDLRWHHCACTIKYRAQNWRCEQGIIFFSRITNLHAMYVYVLLLYATIGQEKPAGFQVLIVYATILKGAGYELAGSGYVWNNCSFHLTVSSTI